MAKLRVHELAKQLKLTNKALMDRLTALSIPFKTILSPLEEEDIERVMASLDQTAKKGKATAPAAAAPKTTVVKKRTAVRKKPVEPPPDVQPVGEPSEGPVEEAVSAEPVGPAVQEPRAEVEAPTEISTIEEAAPTEVPAEPTPEAVAPEVQPSPTEDVQTLKQAVEAPSEEVPLEEPKPEEPRPEISEIRALAPEPPAEAPIPVSEDLAPTKEPEVPAAPVDEATVLEAAPEAPTDILHPEPVEPMTQTAPAAAAPEAEPEPVESRVDKAGKRKKKVKKDMPAKIIKLPEAPSEPLAEPEARPEPARREIPQPGAKPMREDRPVKPVAPTVEETTESALKDKDKKKKKTPKEIEDELEERKLPKKKAGFKKKEVVESADLYTEGERQRKMGKKGKQQKAAPQPQKTLITTPKAIKRRIKVDDTIILSELAKRMGVKASELIVKLMGLGVMATVNQAIDYDTAVLVATEFGYEVERAAFEEESLIHTEDIDPSKLMPRPPVVTIMGHVDHGKTSLLDVIRKTRVTEAEAGGITQHIGAYHVETERGQIVFLDTPGHEAFTAMRSRGAGITDIVVLVVAADDGVMPQTIEAINHSKAANVPIIVAVNKIDKPGADPDRVQRGLADVGLISEQWGGDTIFVKVSAKTKQGIDELLDMILLQAEVLDLKADPNRLAFGHVIEAKLDAGRGPVATVLVQQGTLKAGDPVVCGVHYGKVRALLDDRGRPVDSAGPSMPVEVIGLSGVPVAGDEIIALADEKDARNVSMHRLQKQRAKELAKTNRVSLDKLFEKMKEGEVKDLNLILKADVQGSIEALTDALLKLSNEEVNIRIVHSGTGAITESDISLATVSNAIILGFNVRPTAKIQTLASEEHVDMRFYNVIYNLIKDVKDAIVGMMKSTFEERILGRAEVREVFNIPKVGAIAGCYVQDGKIQRGKSIRVVRDGIVVYEGKISSLKRYKDDAKEVLAGYECGVGIENFNDIKHNDILECFYLEELKPEIEAEPAR
ncbi:MAG: translation initiation factor IF-2 [Thermodesulfobacteriota bacterium]